jgi:hypothetical protein
MDDHHVIAEIVRWLMGVPSDRVTWHHVALMGAGVVIWVLPAVLRLYHFTQHTRFIRSATPEQLAAYTGKLPPPPPPSLGGPAAILLLLLALGMTGGPTASETSAKTEQTSAAESDDARNCCRDCDPPSRCVRCHCEAATKQGKEEQRQRDERLTSRPPLQSELYTLPATYAPRWHRYLPES